MFQMEGFSMLLIKNLLLGGTMLGSKKTTTMFMIALLLMTVTVTNSTNVSGTHLLSASAESVLNGGGSFSAFADGLAIGMGVATLFGCIWCAGVSIGLKVAILRFR
jgi:hypothetical protein